MLQKDPRPVVAHVVREYLPRSETFTYTQIRTIERFRAVVFAWLLNHPEAFPWDPVVQVAPPLAAPLRPLRHLRSRAAGAGSTFEYRLRGLLDDAGARLVHAHFGWMGVSSLFAARALRLPLVTTFHAADIVLAGPASERGYPRLFSEGTLFTAVGPTMAQRLGARGAPADRIRIVKLGIDLDRVRFTPPAEGRPLVILQVGRLVPKKGVALSLRAFAQARRRLGESRLVIVGDGPQRADLARLADELGIAPQVDFLGALDHAATLQLMRRAHLGLQPSQTAPNGDIEGTPTVLLEMQATGLPVIATEHADIPSIVARPEDLVPEGQVEPLADAILRVASLSTSERLRRARQARQLVESNHSLARARTAIEAVYDEALERRPAA